NGYVILSEPGAEPTSRIKLSYPISSVLGRKFSLQPNFFGVELYNDSDDEISRILGGPDLIESGDEHRQSSSGEKFFVW
ncbi:unnamed protein product, partial [Haemonchus placei]|uniref:Flagellar motor switch protein FliM n=1 Tax=Haemonchus placei TaxID=6290 RepID=A0A0N4VXV5_HAEPC